jgi:hypothetical protein
VVRTVESLTVAERDASAATQEEEARTVGGIPSRRTRTKPLLTQWPSGMLGAVMLAGDGWNIEVSDTLSSLNLSEIVYQEIETDAIEKDALI